MSKATAHTGGLWWWLCRLLSGKPHIEIGGYTEGDEVPDVYLRRWYLIPRNRLLNIYLHQFLRDDDDRALHDHPWDSVSLLVRGSYVEYTPDPENPERHRYWPYSAGDMVFRRAEYRHRLELMHPEAPCWTIFITGPKRRDWGFWCPQGFVPWREFTDGADGEHIGTGCGE